MNTFQKVLLLLSLVLALAACTKRNNLTGNNWSDVSAITYTDSLSVIDGYSFPADSLVSLNIGRKALLVGSWQGSEAKAVMRFTALPDYEALNGYHYISDATLELVLLRRDTESEHRELKLKLYKVLRSYVVPDSLQAQDLEHFADYDIPAVIGVQDTLRIPLATDWLKTWQSKADSTGLNIYLELDQGNTGFLEFQLSSVSRGSKLSFAYTPQENAEKEIFSTYASKEDFSFSHPEAEVLQQRWKISNFAPQRFYIDLQPEYSFFKDSEANSLDSLAISRCNINKAELVLFPKDLPNFKNTFAYKLSAYLVKEVPEAGEIVPTAGMETISFAFPLDAVFNSNADSVKIDITPILQAYTSGKKEAKGIVIMSQYERKDFGEVEFYHPLSAPPEKAPYLKVKYTPPFL
ncbi:MAG: hypothetical protein PHC50_05760 [Candidatus Cloacimonetes bacterium]|nr:hypothetical protein [Candidatus Cloacimonadota bacterium]